MMQNIIQIVRIYSLASGVLPSTVQRCQWRIHFTVFDYSRPCCSQLFHNISLFYQPCLLLAFMLSTSAELSFLFSELNSRALCSIKYAINQFTIVSQLPVISALFFASSLINIPECINIRHSLTVVLSLSWINMDGSDRRNSIRQMQRKPALDGLRSNNTTGTIRVRKDARYDYSLIRNVVATVEL